MEYSKDSWYIGYLGIEVLLLEFTYLRSSILNLKVRERSLCNLAS